VDPVEVGSGIICHPDTKLVEKPELCLKLFCGGLVMNPDPVGSTVFGANSLYKSNPILPETDPGLPTWLGKLLI
jgi:hypothetical protein